MRQVTGVTYDCGCLVALEWDDAEADVARTHLPIAITPCAAHQAEAAGAPLVPPKYERRGADLLAHGRPVPKAAHPAAARAHAKVSADAQRRRGST